MEKDSVVIEDLKIKYKKGKFASIIGLICNIFLSVAKIIIGLMFGLISVLADGFNNFTDCGSSLVSIISFKMSSKPADKEHPFGHERIEYVCSMAISFLILLIAFELLKESIIKIITPQTFELSVIVFAVLSLSILIKAAMFVYYNLVAKKINSVLLKAAAIDSLSDCISTSVAVISLIVAYFFGVNIDGYAGLVIAIFISFAGVKILKEMISKLIGQAPDKSIFEMVKSKILSHDKVLGIHDLNIHSYGPNKYFATVHIEVDAKIDSLIAHELIDEIEREFLCETNIILTGHHDPIVIDDEEVLFMREQVEKFVFEIDQRFSMHDFRMVKGPTKTNIIFDIAIPFDVEVNENQLIETLKLKVAEINKKYQLVVLVEKQMYI